MGLKVYQSLINLNTLYTFSRIGGMSGSEQLKPSLEVTGGTVNIFVSQDQPLSPPANMNILTNGDDFSGIAPLAFIPNYFYIVQSTGNTTKMILSGVTATVVS